MFWATLYDLSHSDTVLFRMFETRQHNYINAYVCKMHMVGGISAAGT